MSHPQVPTSPASRERWWGNLNLLDKVRSEAAKARDARDKGLEKIDKEYGKKMEKCHDTLNKCEAVVAEREDEVRQQEQVLETSQKESTAVELQKEGLMQQLKDLEQLENNVKQAIEKQTALLEDKKRKSEGYKALLDSCKRQKCLIQLEQSKKRRDVETQCEEMEDSLYYSNYHLVRSHFCYRLPLSFSFFFSFIFFKKAKKHLRAHSQNHRVLALT